MAQKRIPMIFRECAVCAIARYMRFARKECLSALRLVGEQYGVF